MRGDSASTFDAESTVSDLRNAVLRSRPGSGVPGAAGRGGSEVELLRRGDSRMESEVYSDVRDGMVSVEDAGVEAEPD